MTYKYQYIRRAIYEDNPMKIVNHNRSIKEVTMLFKKPYLITFLILYIPLVVLILYISFHPYNFYLYIPLFIIAILLTFLQIPREKYLYNDSARSEELSEMMQNYAQYVGSVQKTIQAYGIDTPDKFLKLKAECESILQKHKNKLEKINSKVFDMLIGVPLGAFIASIIYSDSSAIPSVILLIIFLGVAIIGLLKALYFISYYSDGYVKDQYLLDVISELDYFAETTNSING